MSRRCELQKAYYQKYGNYKSKGDGTYSDEYVKWLEDIAKERLIVKSNNPKEFLINKYKFISDAVENGYDIRLNEEEILQVMKEYALYYYKQNYSVIDWD